VGTGLGKTSETPKVMIFYHHLVRTALVWFSFFRIKERKTIKKTMCVDGVHDNFLLFIQVVMLIIYYL